MGIPIIGDVINAAKDIVSEVVVDKDKKNELNYKFQELEDRANQRLHEEVMAQSEVNKAEAAHPSIFVAGWRPFIGWGCGAAFIYSAILAPLFKLQPADIAFVQTILMGMLGIAGMRSFEKVKRVETKSTAPVRKAKKGEPENILPPQYRDEEELPEDAPWTK